MYSKSSKISQILTRLSSVDKGGFLPGGSTTIDLWTQGKVYDTNFPAGTYVAGGAPKPLPPKTGTLMGGPNNGFFERSKPQYETIGVGEFINANLLLRGTSAHIPTKTKLIKL